MDLGATHPLVAPLGFYWSIYQCAFVIYRRFYIDTQPDINMQVHIFVDYSLALLSMQLKVVAHPEPPFFLKYISISLVFGLPQFVCCYLFIGLLNQHP